MLLPLFVLLFGFSRLKFPLVTVVCVCSETAKTIRALNASYFRSEVDFIKSKSVTGLLGCKLTLSNTQAIKYMNLALLQKG
jgi:hypothetical protein